jgi:hypothetical protein
MCYVKIHGKPHYACFTCRKVFRPTEEVFARGTCPECRRPMASMGICFKAPRQADVRQWRKVEILYKEGYTYRWESCCPGHGPGFRPRTLAEIPEFLAERVAEKGRNEQRAKSEASYGKRRESMRKKKQQRDKVRTAKALLAL